MAAARGSEWKGEIVFYVTDNMNVRSWITKRRPKHPLARHLVRLVQRLEACHGFSTTALYIRTYHNDIADWLSREEAKKVHSELLRKGWTRIEPPEAWGKMLAEAKEHLLRLPGEDGPIAEAALRHRASIHQPSPRR